MLGGNLPDNREFEESLFTNAEVLAVNQQGQNPHQLYKTNDRMIWVSAAPGTAPSYYVALFNLSDRPQDVPLEVAALGLKKKVAIRDLWSKTDLGIITRQYTRSLPAHASALLKITEQ